MNKFLLFWSLPLGQVGDAEKNLNNVRVRLIILAAYTIYIVGIASLSLVWVGAEQSFNAAPLYGALGMTVVGLWWVGFLSAIISTLRPVTLSLVPQFKQSLAYATALMWLFLVLLTASYFVQPVIFCIVVGLVATTQICNWVRLKKIALMMALAWTIYAQIMLLLGNTSSVDSNFYSAIFYNAQTLMMFMVSITYAMTFMALASLKPWLAICMGIVGYAAIKFLQIPESAVINSSTWASVHQLLQPFFVVFTLTLFMPALWAWRILAGREGKLIARLASLRQIKRNAVYVLEWQPGLLIYSKLLNWDIKKRQTPEKMMHYLLGPWLYWKVVNMWILLAGAIVWAMSLFLGKPILEMLHGQTFLPIFMIVVFGNIVVNKSIYLTKREQTLISLAPKFLLPNQHNRWLAAWALRYTFTTTVWLAIVVGGSLLAAGLLPFAIQERTVVVTLVNLLALLGTLLRDVSLDKSEFTLGRDWFDQILLPMLAGCLPLFAMMIFKKYRHGLWLVLIMAILFVVYRWWRLIRSPHAFPVGRLSAP